MPNDHGIPPLPCVEMAEKPDGWYARCVFGGVGPYETREDAKVAAYNEAGWLSEQQTAEHAGCSLDELRRSREEGITFED